MLLKHNEARGTVLFASQTKDEIRGMQSAEQERQTVFFASASDPPAPLQPMFCSS